MNRFFRLISIGMLALVASQAHTIDLGPVLIAFNQPSQSGSPGDTLTFTASLSNLSQGEVFLNSNSINFSSSSDFTLTDLFFFTVPLSLQGGETQSNIDLFTVTISPSFSGALGDYAGLYTLIGGADPQAQDNVTGPVSFDVFVNAATATPEPSTVGLFLMGGAALLARLRNRKP